MALRRTIKIAIRIAIAAGAVALAVVALRPDPIAVETVKVRRAPMQTVIEAEGKTRVRDRYVLAAPVAGRLQRIVLRRGDEVRSGAVVARIEPAPIQPLDARERAETEARIAAALARQREAEALVVRAETECGQARRERERAERLVESGDISRQEYDRLCDAEYSCLRTLDAVRFRASAAVSEVDAARAALLALERAGARDASPPVEVRAPAAGSVLRVIEESERVVAAGAPLLEVSNPGRLEIIVDVLSTEAVRIAPGAAMIIDGWGGDEMLRAQVRLVEPSAFTKVSALGVEEQRVYVIGDLMDAPGRLGDGFRLGAKIVVWEGEGVLQAPQSALFRRGDGWAAFVADAGRARLREVATGRRGGFDMEILGGLQEGEDLIMHPSGRLVDGARILIRAAAF
ncbi:MAG: efflux RND transporter periplasmic adaptor subunit [Blastocatellales bacterium]|nr:efflux RND transporter periplasmic adaptor subunit [Blastocatellales bacterium]